ncbi:threonyl-trna synthetase [Lasius niger]|uniref:Threonyl-trna synthetase n=1 Tax=Lasius niger TaxID=67767 RepID=A0A0J7KSP9_LASNI|nr:threonyl-trna synthetase [Lasius niger]
MPKNVEEYKKRIARRNRHRSKDAIRDYGCRRRKENCRTNKPTTKPAANTATCGKKQIKILNITIAYVDNLEKILQENEKRRFLNITIRMRDQRIGYKQREDLDNRKI